MQQKERTEGLFEPTGEHQQMADHLTRRWAEAQAVAQARLEAFRTRREEASAPAEPASR